MNTEPLSCPFCGTAPSVRDDSGVVTIECGNQSCFIVCQIVTWDDMEIAVKKWNQRELRQP